VSDLCTYVLSEDGVATVTLNRPDARNAVNVALLEALLDRLEQARADAAGVLLLTAAGKTFCAGADLKEGLPGQVASGSRSRRELVDESLQRIAELPLSVAMVRGAAVGAGWALALACDLTLAAPTATFRWPELSLGVTPPEAAVRRLAREVGPRRALALIANEHLHPATELAPLGLVDVVADQWLDEAARTTARELAKRDRAALAEVKRIVNTERVEAAA
jgi:enoyl-CoA hydratase/carnithine racemase